MNNELDVLGTMRAIRDDKSLSTTDFALLMAAVLRTDNKTSKVRYSLELLAVDANVSTKTAERAFKKPEVLKYFKTVNRSSRRVDLWFASVNVIRLRQEEGNDGLCVPNDGHSVHNDGHSVRPSTLSSTLSSTKEDAPPAAPVVPISSKNKVREDSPSLNIKGGTPPNLDGLSTTEEAPLDTVSVNGVYTSEQELRERRRQLGLLA